VGLLDADELVAGMDAQERDELVVGNMPLVIFFANIYRTAGVDLDDLIGAGALALVQAVDRYDPKRGKVATYARWGIRSAVRRARRGELRHWARRRVAADGKDDDLLAMVPDDRGDVPGERMLAEIDGERLRRALGCIDPEDARVIRLLFGLDGAEPMTRAEAGATLGISAERIRQRAVRGLARLRRLLKEK